jgi:ribosome-associated protein
MTFVVPEAELRVRAARASGPGGQHVNKTSTKVAVSWDVERSPSLSDDQRRLLVTKLANRIDKHGRLHVSAAARRSQAQNRRAAIDRLNDLVTQALNVRPPRKATAPPPSANEARLAAKKQRAEVKETRKPVSNDD